MNNTKNEDGAILLIAVIVMMAISLVVALTINLSGLSELQTGLTQDESTESFLHAETCAEEAYYRLKRSSAYSGGTITFADGGCSITITPSGSNRTIEVSGTREDLTREIQAETTLEQNSTTEADGIALDSWIEE